MKHLISAIKKNEHIKLIAKAYLLAIAFFAFFRIILFITELDRVTPFSANTVDILKAFIMGLRFDIVISGYILLFPFIFISVFYIAGLKSKLFYTVVFFLLFLAFSFALLICAADIPYYNQFVSRFSAEAFQWMESPAFVFKMIIQEPRYFIIIIPFVILIFAFYKLLKRIIVPLQRPSFSIRDYMVSAVLTLITIGVMFAGIRGRLQQKSPIRIGTAYFCDNPFLNQLGLNPVFTFMRSFLDSKDERNQAIQLMDDERAIDLVQQYLQISQPVPEEPIARYITPDTISPLKHNVILVIMEAMSAAKMSRHGNTKNLTPFLDSISKQSYYFENTYTAGKHTRNGIFASLFSFPTIYQQHAMRESNIKKYNGMGPTLKSLGYSTTYFTTHDGQFDNVEGFLRANEFDYIYTQSNYPAKEIVSTLGVPDDYMFRFAMPVIDELYDEDKPFFVAFMTASDHGPYYVPEYFTPHNEALRDQVVEYADWSLHQMVSTASEKEWFDNTLFVFIADHGAPISYEYDISLDYHHSPFIIYAPSIIQDPCVYSNIAGQIDVFPTVMGVLKLPYINNTLGIDARNETRPFTIISDNDKFGVLDTQNLLIIKEDSKHLYHYSTGDKTDYSGQQPGLAKEMEDYGKANLQVFQYMMLHNKTWVNVGGDH